MTITTDTKATEATGQLIAGYNDRGALCGLVPLIGDRGRLTRGTIDFVEEFW